MPTTHLDFHTLVPEVADAEAMNTTVGRAICHQYLFDRRTSPREVSLWAPGELQEFNISLQCVDRLYHIYKSEDHIFELVTRVEYKDRYLFVELSCSCYFEGFECQGGGQIYVSYSASLFTKVITTKLWNEELFYQSLAQDGYLVEGRSVFERCPPARWHTPPSLMALSHLTVSNNKDNLGHYRELLPTAVAQSVDEFVQVQEAVKDYDEWE
ncbi:uncharacterized protein LOC127000095 [Eriocheir sinensis]|uniref:uncharacterized protein LOC127000095 n=1 Tax=Eriocheir sinensis TaxID=95602 RepID=UPI0021C5C1C5|nr:uncharacterized protein LOC127000095 [Eriocheir sinensis]